MRRSLSWLSSILSSVEGDILFVVYCRWLLQTHKLRKRCVNLGPNTERCTHPWSTSGGSQPSKMWKPGTRRCWRRTTDPSRRTPRWRLEPLRTRNAFVKSIQGSSPFQTSPRLRVYPWEPSRLCTTVVSRRGARVIGPGQLLNSGDTRGCTASSWRARRIGRRMLIFNLSKRWITKKSTSKNGTRVLRYQL